MMNPTAFDQSEKAMQRLKKEEKQIVEKPFERPVQRVDHDDRRKKFSEAVEHKKDERKKSRVEEELAQPGSSPATVRSLFDLIKKDKKQSLEEIDLQIENEESLSNTVSSPYYIPAVSVEASLPQETITISSRQAEFVKAVEQLVEALSVMKVEGRTETTITLKEPPLFAGVSIIVVQDKLAANELNIAFHNVFSVDARMAIESMHSQELLKAHLLENGYTLQMITIEPKLDIKTVAQAERPSPDHHQEKQQEKEKQE